MSIADRIAVMRSGELMQIGPPLSLYDDPTNFVGCAIYRCTADHVIQCALDDAMPGCYLRRYGSGRMETLSSMAYGVSLTPRT